MSFRRPVMVLFIAAAVPASVALGIAQSARTPASYKAPRTYDGKPNFNGIWQALNTANWDIEPHGAQAGPKQFGALFSIPPGAGIVEGGEIPYKPEARRLRDEHTRKRWTDDPEVKVILEDNGGRVGKGWSGDEGYRMGIPSVSLGKISFPS